MTDEKTSRIWASPNFRNRLRALGFPRFPEHVAVGLFVSKAAESEPVDVLLRCHEFQRASVALAREHDAGSGRIGNHGVTFLYAGRGSRERARRSLRELTERAAEPAQRRYGLALHTGLGQATRSLSEQYQEALAAADSALARGLRVVEAGDLPAGPALGALRRDLALGLDTEPNAVPVRFERYLAAVAHRSGYGLETARVHLEAGFERIVEVIQASGSIDARTLSTELGRLSQAAGEARTTDELFDAYRQAVGSLIELVADPHAARRDHGLDRAERYVRRHYAEPLGLERVARVAGYAPKYFSDLFRKKQGRTFESYVLGVRIERVKQLLSGSDLTLQRVAQLTGLGTGNYLGRVFQRSLGETPIAYRRRVRGALVAQRAREGARPKVSRRHSATIRHTPSVKFDE